MAEFKDDLEPLDPFEIDGDTFAEVLQALREVSDTDAVLRQDRRAETEEAPGLPVVDSPPALEPAARGGAEQSGETVADALESPGRMEAANLGEAPADPPSELRTPAEGQEFPEQPSSEPGREFDRDIDPDATQRVTITEISDQAAEDLARAISEHLEDENVTEALESSALEGARSGMGFAEKDDEDEQDDEDKAEPPAASTPEPAPPPPVPAEPAEPPLPPWPDGPIPPFDNLRDTTESLGDSYPFGDPVDLESAFGDPGPFGQGRSSRPSQHQPGREMDGLEVFHLRDPLPLDPLPNRRIPDQPTGFEQPLGSSGLSAFGVGGTGGAPQVEVSGRLEVDNTFHLEIVDNNSITESLGRQIDESLIRRNAEIVQLVNDRLAQMEEDIRVGGLSG